MLREARSEWYPVGFVDDDRAKRHLRVRGVPVLGEIARLTELIERFRAEVRAGTAEAGAWGVRVHDVAATKAALDVWEAWSYGARSGGNLS